MAYNGYNAEELNSNQPFPWQRAIVYKTPHRPWAFDAASKMRRKYGINVWLDGTVMTGWKVIVHADDFDRARRMMLSLEALALVENLLFESPELKTLKTARRQLDPEEREEVMKAGAVWHHGPDGEPTPGVWKAVVNGKTWYVSNTHRCYQAKPTLKGAIRAFHDVVEPSS